MFSGLASHDSYPNSFNQNYEFICRAFLQHQSKLLFVLTFAFVFVLLTSVTQYITCYFIWEIPKVVKTDFQQALNTALKAHTKLWLIPKLSFECISNKGTKKILRHLIMLNEQNSVNNCWGSKIQLRKETCFWVGKMTNLIKDLTRKHENLSWISRLQHRLCLMQFTYLGNTLKPKTIPHQLLDSRLGKKRRK